MDDRQMLNSPCVHLAAGGVSAMKPEGLVHLAAPSGQVASPASRGEAAGYRTAAPTQPEPQQSVGIRYRIAGPENFRWRYEEHPALIEEIRSLKNEDGDGFFYEVEPLYVRPLQCDGRGAPSGQSGLDEDEQWTLDRAGDLLEHYADYIKTVKPDDIECHPYLPELEQVSADLRAFTKRLSGGGSHYVGAACPQGASSRLEAPLADARFQRPDHPEPVWCGCGDGIMPDTGAKCGTCVAIAEMYAEDDSTCELLRQAAEALERYADTFGADQRVIDVVDALRLRAGRE